MGRRRAGPRGQGGLRLECQVALVPRARLAAAVGGDGRVDRDEPVVTERLSDHEGAASAPDASDIAAPQKAR